MQNTCVVDGCVSVVTIIKCGIHVLLMVVSVVTIIRCGIHVLLLLLDAEYMCC